MNKKLLFGIVLVIFLAVVICVLLLIKQFYRSVSTSSKTTPTPTTTLAQMANPAATNCIAKGGTLEKVTTTAGEDANCVFPNGAKCEEWAFFRGECVNTFCGGIANISCPSGYQCTLDGTYPDAGGTCYKK